MNYRQAGLLTVVALSVTASTAVFILGGPSAAASRFATDAAATPAAETADRGKGGEIWGADYFPNVPLTTHDGRTVRFFDDLIKDKVVAVNFIYTTCPDACPMETARLLEVQELVGADRMGRDVFFYSITIDPEYDTQPVLAKFVEDWQIGPGWSFLTGKEEDITLLRKKLGVYIEEIQSETSRDHNLSLVIGNQSTGRWMRRSPFENAHVLAKQIGGELHNWKMASTTKRDYAHAPKLRNISKGESLFRTRCAACHTIGDGDIVEPKARRIGPDLYKITEQRDPRVVGALVGRARRHARGEGSARHGAHGQVQQRADAQHAAQRLRGRCDSRPHSRGERPGREARQDGTSTGSVSSEADRYGSWVSWRPHGPRRPHGPQNHGSQSCDGSFDLRRSPGSWR